MTAVRLTVENVERLVRVCNRVEGWPVNDQAIPGQPRTAGTPHTALFQVTSTSQTNGWYPGQWQSFDPDTLAKAPGGSEAGWIRGPNDEILSLNQYYIARLMGVQQSDGLAVWMTCGVGGSAAPLIAGVATGGSIAAATNVSTAIPWNSGRSSFWNAANPTRLTVPAGQPANGLYLLAGEATFTAIDIASHLSLHWCKNGTYSTPFDGTGLCDGSNQVKVSDIAYYQLTGGDYMELVARHDAPAAIIVSGLNCWIDYKGIF